MSKTITDLQSTMFEMLQDLRNGDLDIETARVAKDMCQTIINSAKAEVDMIKAYDETGVKTPFLEGDTATGRRKHRIQG